jgi:hypothetical protein
MKTIFKKIALCGIIALMAFSCEKEEEILPPNQAKGRIIETFRMCYGYWVMIEVENPKGIGEAALPRNEEPWKNYKNAIGVPYFDRIPELNTEAPDAIGTWLHFEYRELTNEERNSNIFVDTSFHGICTHDIIPPNTTRYIIIKIIDYY